MPAPRMVGLATISTIAIHSICLLGRLLELAGDDTTVMLVSDHGFHSDHIRLSYTDGAELTESQAIAWHRKYGVIALRGPGIKKDERIYGATLLDIAPTVLTLFDIPIGRIMDGTYILIVHLVLQRQPPG